MNWRALGCGLVAVAVFLAISIFGLSLALTPAGCPEQLQYGPTTYRPIGSAGSEPRFPGDDGTPVAIGSTFIGLTTRTVYARPDAVPASGTTVPPPDVVLDCADGTFQAYASGDGSR